MSETRAKQSASRPRKAAAARVETEDKTVRPLQQIAMSTADQMCRDIVEGLYQGRYVTGQRLVETDLTLEYGVSRGTVRESLKRLAAEGIVTLNLHRGAQIRRLTRMEVHDMLALLEVLIGFAARLAAENIGEGTNVTAFSQAFNDLISFETKPDSFDLLHVRDKFYRSMVDIAANNELRRVLPGIQVHLLRVQFRRYRSQIEAESFSDYKEIGRAILAADPKRAETSGRRHIKRIASAYEMLPKDAF